MATFAEASEKKRALSGQVSSLARSLSFGVLAVTWLFLSGSKDPPAMVAVVPKGVMLAIAAICVLALAFDLMHYMAAYKQVAADYDAAKDSKAKEVTYHPGDVRQWMFTWKVRLAIVASLSLVLVLSWAAVNTPESQVCTRATQGGP